MALTTKPGPDGSRIFDVADLPTSPSESETPSNPDIDDRDLTIDIADRVQPTEPTGTGSATLDPVYGGPLPSLPAYVGDESVYQVGLYFAQLAAVIAAQGQVAFSGTVLGLASGATVNTTIEVAEQDRNGVQKNWGAAVTGHEFRFATPRGGQYRIVLTADAVVSDGAVTLTGDVTFWVDHVEAVETVNVGMVGGVLDDVGGQTFPPTEPDTMELGDWVFDGTADDPSHGEFKLTADVYHLADGQEAHGDLDISVFDAADDDHGLMLLDLDPGDVIEFMAASVTGGLSYKCRISNVPTLVGDHVNIEGDWMRDGDAVAMGQSVTLVVPA